MCDEWKSTERQTNPSSVYSEDIIIVRIVCFGKLQNLQYGSLQKQLQLLLQIFKNITFKEWKHTPSNTAVFQQLEKQLNYICFLFVGVMSTSYGPRHTDT